LAEKQHYKPAHRGESISIADLRFWIKTHAKFSSMFLREAYDKHGSMGYPNDVKKLRFAFENLGR